MSHPSSQRVRWDATDQHHDGTCNEGGALVFELAAPKRLFIDVSAGSSQCRPVRQCSSKDERPSDSSGRLEANAAKTSEDLMSQPIPRVLNPNPIFVSTSASGRQRHGRKRKGSAQPRNASHACRRQLLPALSSLELESLARFAHLRPPQQPNEA